VVSQAVLGYATNFFHDATGPSQAWTLTTKVWRVEGLLARLVATRKLQLVAYPRLRRRESPEHSALAAQIVANVGGSFCGAGTRRVSSSVDA